MKETRTRTQEYTVTICDVCGEDDTEQRVLSLGSYADGVDVHYECVRKLIDAHKSTT